MLYSSKKVIPPLLPALKRARLSPPPQDASELIPSQGATVHPIPSLPKEPPPPRAPSCRAVLTCTDGELVSGRPGVAEAAHENGGGGRCKEAASGPAGGLTEPTAEPGHTGDVTASERRRRAVAVCGPTARQTHSHAARLSDTHSHSHNHNHPEAGRCAGDRPSGAASGGGGGGGEGCGGGGEGRGML